MITDRVESWEAYDFIALYLKTDPTQFATKRYNAYLAKKGKSAFVDHQTYGEPGYDPSRLAFVVDTLEMYEDARGTHIRSSGSGTFSSIDVSLSMPHYTYKERFMDEILGISKPVLLEYLQGLETRVKKLRGDAQDNVADIIAELKYLIEQRGWPKNWLHDSTTPKESVSK